jgi:putative transposase
LDGPIKKGPKDFSPLQNDRPDGSTLRSPSKTVGSIVRGFKIGVGDWLRKNTDMSAIWQRNYFEHIIRNEAELKQTRQYIRDNPAAWVEDEENLERIGRGSTHHPPILAD